MPIAIVCPCGKGLRVKDEHAGKRVKCPACAAVLTVPAPQPPPEEEIPTLEAVDEPDEKPRESEADTEDDDVDLPGSNRKRVGRGTTEPYWAYPDGVDSLIVLTDEALRVAQLSAEDLDDAVEKLDSGQPVHKVLRGRCTIIPFADMTRIESNLKGESIDVTWKAVGAAEPTETNVLCQSKKARDEVLEGLEDRLGDGWRARTEKYSRLRAAMTPAWTTLLLLFICFCLYMVAAGHDRGGGGGGGLMSIPQWIFSWALRVVGPAGTLVIMGLFTLLGVLWTIASIRNPPVMRILEPRTRSKRRG